MEACIHKQYVAGCTQNESVFGQHDSARSQTHLVGVDVTVGSDDLGGRCSHVVGRGGVAHDQVGPVGSSGDGGLHASSNIKHWLSTCTHQLSFLTNNSCTWRLRTKKQLSICIKHQPTDERDRSGSSSNIDTTASCMSESRSSSSEIAYTSIDSSTLLLESGGKGLPVSKRQRSLSTCLMRRWLHSCMDGRLM